MTSGLSPTDVDCLLGAAETLMTASSLGQLRQRAVEALVALVPSTLVAWNEVDVGNGRIDAVTSAPVEGEPALSEAFITHVCDHPVIARQRSTGDPQPLAISDFVSPRTFLRTGIYADFYRHLDALDQLSFLLPARQALIAVAVNRDRWGFSDRDRAVCALLRPLLAQTYRVVTTAAQMEELLRRCSGDIRDHPLVTEFQLSEREAEVLYDVAAGMASKQIAAKLGISRRTVDKHVQHAVAKLGVRTRLQAAAIVRNRLTVVRPGDITG